MTFSSRSSEDTKLQEWAEKVRKERGGGKETTRLKYPMHAELRKEKIEESQREREREKERILIPMRFVGMCVCVYV